MNHRRPQPAASDPRKRSTRSLRVTQMGLVMLAFGLLLWARFTLITGHPKTALAEPDRPALAALEPAPAHGAEPTEVASLGDH